MAKLGDLAGLAALGALGYKLFQGKGAPVEDRKGTPVSQDDRDFAAMEASMATMRPQRGNPMSEDLLSDDGTPTGLRRNLETGDLYNPNVTAAPARTSRKTSAPAAKTDEEPKASTGMSSEEMARIRAAGGPRGRYSAVATPKTTMGKTYPYNPANVKDEDVPTDLFTMKKKGGKVKKMASGGMTKKPAAKGWGKARGAREAKYY